MPTDFAKSMRLLEAELRRLEAGADAELTRLLGAYRDAVYDLACDGPEYPTIECRVALLSYVEREYVRRDQARDELLDEQANDARWNAFVGR